MTPETLTPKVMIMLFDELSDYLAEVGEHGHLFVVGGAAMALAYNPDRATNDIDAIFTPYHAVVEAVEVIAGRHDLPPDWLNDAVKTFSLNSDPHARTIYETEHLTVVVPSPEYLLAMKVQSGRLTRDVGDALNLSQLLTLGTPEEIIAVVESQHPGHVLSSREQYFIEAVVSRFDP